MFGGGPLGVVEVYEVMRVEPPLWISALIRRGRDRNFLCLGHVEIQQEGSHLLARKRAFTKNPVMLAPRSWTYQPPEL